MFEGSVLDLTHNLVQFVDLLGLVVSGSSRCNETVPQQWETEGLRRKEPGFGTFGISVYSFRV